MSWIFLIILMFENTLQPTIAAKFPAGIPILAKLLIRTDNSPSQNWAHKVSSRSEKGQHMVHTYAALLERTTLAVACNHIAGKTNSLADFISRPPTHLPSPASRQQQIFEKEPKLASYRYFRPHPIAISGRIRNCYPTWNPGCSANDGTQQQLCQSRSDNSKPQDPLPHLLSLSKIGR
jgi:hypothetical protein